MRKLFAAACTAAFVLASCQEESFEGRDGSDNYYASVETFGTGTKTALGEGRSIVWSSEDRIAVFEGNGAGQGYQVLDSYVGKSSGEFAEVEGLMTEGTGAGIGGTIAVYPFNEDLTVTSGDDETYVIEGITFPSEQKYIAGSFSDEAFPMAAVCEQGNKSLSFRNIGGVLKLSLTGSYSVSQITLTGNSGEPLSGSATVTLSSDGIPSVTMSDDASTSVTLICDPAVQLDSEKATDFYISIPPTEFEMGFTVTVTDSEGVEHTKSTEKANNLLRSRIHIMPTLGSDDFTIMKLAENAKVYDEDKTDHFLSAENGKIVIASSMAEEDIPQVGEIIICPITEATPNGYIGKVIASEASASGIEVQTEVVPLHEAFEELHISTTIDMAPYISSVEDGEGNELEFRMVSEEEWPQEAPLTKAEFSKDLNFAVIIENDIFEGSIYQNNRLNVNIDISWFRVERFDVSVEKKSGVKGEWGLIGYETEEFKKTLGQMKIKSLPIPIPGTLITLVPSVYAELFFESKAEVSLTAELGLVLEHQLYKFSYNNGNPASESIDLMRGPKAYFQCSSLEAKGEMALGLTGGINVAFWDEAKLAFGTEITAKGTAGIEAEISMEDELLESNVKVSLTPSVISTVYAESALFKAAGFDDGKISKEFASLDLEELEIYALPRFSKIEKSTEGLEMIAAADVDKLSLIWCEEKGFALFEKDAEEALEHIAFDNPEPNFTTNRDTVVFTLQSAKKEYIAKPYVLAFGKYYYGNDDDRWVDLGLPSGILWAAYNVGASSPEEYGGYYSWGTFGKWDEIDENDIYNYNRGNDISGSKYDVANILWGDGARIPTVTEMDELMENCTFTLADHNNTKGNKVTGPNGNSIFLPFAGSYEDGVEGEGLCAEFWSSSLTGEDLDHAYQMHIGSSCNDTWDTNWVYITETLRELSFTIRPVKDKETGVENQQLRTDKAGNSL